MSVMSGLEARLCRSAPWRGIARHAVLPWVLGGRSLGAEVLEIGAGSGAMAQELLRRDDGIAHLWAVDVDQAMVAAASRRLARFGARADARVVDANGLPFPDGRFDAVCAWLMLHHTVSWERVLGEVRRVLRPGGVLVGYDLCDTAPVRAIHRVTGSTIRLLEPEALDAELRRLGCADVRIEETAGLVFRFEALVAGDGPRCGAPPTGFEPALPA